MGVAENITRIDQSLYNLVNNRIEILIFPVRIKHRNYLLKNKDTYEKFRS